MAKQKSYTAPAGQNSVPPEPDGKKPRKTPSSGSESPDSEEFWMDSKQPKVDDSFEEASQSTADFVQSVEPIQEQRKKSRRLRKVMVIVFVIALLGAGGYFLYTMYSERSTGGESAETEPQADTITVSETEGDPATPTSYSSTVFNLSFDHPGDWRVDDSQEGILKLESPQTELTDGVARLVKATAVITIVAGVDDMDDFPTDQATATRESLKFTYDSPAAGQREETYLSFMNLEGPSRGLGAVYITGDNSYVKGDPVRKADFESVEPVVGVRFFTAEGEPLIIATEDWDSNPALMSAFEILKSLNIK